MNAQPVLFLSHGAPNMILEEAPVRDFLEELGTRLGRPKAILSVTAHWTAARPTVSGDANPETVHDFHGFPEPLYRLEYPAPGAPAVAQRAARLLGDAGLSPAIEPRRGFDHGTWVPLMLMFPQADIPVVEMSVQPGQDAAHHLAVGRALAPLRDDGVLVVASGALTHNLREYAGRDLDAEQPDWVAAFADWAVKRGIEGDEAAVREWKSAPEAKRNHPTPEHFLPFPVAMGAGGGKAGLLHSSVTHGVLRMDVLRWG